MTNQLCRALGVAIVGLALTACNQHSVPDLSPEEKQTVNTLIQDPITRCVGRYLIDLPAQMVSQSRWNHVPAETVGHDRHGVEVWLEPMERLDFEKALRRRHEELKQTKFDMHPEWPFLASSTDIGSESSPAMLFNASDSISIRGGRRLEIFGWKHGYQVVSSIYATDVSFPEEQSEPLNKGITTDVSEKVVQLQAVYARVRGRKETEIPSEPGTCIRNGFVSDAGRRANEDYFARELWHSTAVRGLLFSFETGSPSGADDTMVARGRNAEAIERREDPSYEILRLQSRTDGHVPFDEWLSRGRMAPDVALGHLFGGEGFSTTSTPRQPFFFMDMKNGQDEQRPPDPADPFQYNMRPRLTKAPLSEAEAVAFWDAVTKTIRLRPGAF